jgi:hypothetical protein
MLGEIEQRLCIPLALRAEKIHAVGMKTEFVYFRA